MTNNPDTLTRELQKARPHAWHYKAERHFTQRNECRDIIAEFCAEVIRKASARLTRGFFSPSIIEQSELHATTILQPTIEAAAENLARAYLDTGTAADLAANMRDYGDGHFYVAEQYRKSLTGYLRAYATRRKSGWKPTQIDTAAPAPFSLPHASEAVRRCRRTIKETTIRLDAAAQLLLFAGDADFTALIRRMGERWRNPKENEARAVAVAVDLLPSNTSREEKNRLALVAIESLRPIDTPSTGTNLAARAKNARIRGERKKLRECIKKRTKALRQKFTRHS